MITPMNKNTSEILDMFHQELLMIDSLFPENKEEEEDQVKKKNNQ